MSEETNFLDLSMMNAAELFSDAIADYIPKNEIRPKVLYRAAGDTYILVEYGEMTLDLNLTFRVYALDKALKALCLKGLNETAPGVRSLLVHYNNLELSLHDLLHHLKEIETTLPPLGKAEVPSRIINLPIAYRERWTKEAVKKYMNSVRTKAPYLPDNVEFIARCNDLKVKDVVTYHTATKHMVLALGDVYLGAPCAVPLDPRRRLVVPKYNPARMWTPEGAVGIGGSYVCIYPMESPGGYQLIGRTLSIWNTHQTSPSFKDAPWLLRPFDRIQFEEVTEAEIEELREKMLSGNYKPKIEEGIFNLEKHNFFCDSVREEVEKFKKKQKEAISRWTEDY